MHREGHINGNTFMYLLSKRLNTAGVTVSPCMYIQNGAADFFSAPA